jgi:hypothetical protein
MADLRDPGHEIQLNDPQTLYRRWVPLSTL